MLITLSIIFQDCFTGYPWANIKLAKMDVDKTISKKFDSKEYGINGFPTMVLFRDGKMESKYEGRSI